jgi:serine/threonine-protein kinase
MRSTKNVDGRTDIWSLGIILYELVAGRTPFQADTFSALCVKIAVDPHPAVLALPAKLPPGFEAVVNRALEKDPAMRYRSAAELALALVPYAGASARERAQRLISASRIAMPSAAHQVILGPHASTIEAASGQALLNTRRLHGGSRALAIAGTGIAAAAVIGFVVSVTRSSGGGEGRDNRDSRVDPRGQRRELPHAVGQPDPIEPHAPLDAGASSSIPVAPSPSASVPSQAAPPAPPPAGRPDAAEPAPATPVPAKSRSRPATLDPYSSPD